MVNIPHNFRWVIFRRSQIFAIFAFIFSWITDFCVCSFLPASATDAEKPSHSWDIPLFGDQKRTIGHPEVVNLQTQRNDPLTVHTCTYKCSLRSARIRLSVASMKIHRLYRNMVYLSSTVSIIILATCDVTANQPAKIFTGWNFRGWLLIHENHKSFIPQKLKCIWYTFQGDNWQKGWNLVHRFKPICTQLHWKVFSVEIQLAILLYLISVPMKM